MSSDNLQENCRLCQQHPGTVSLIDNKEFINKVFEVTRVKIDHDHMQLFPNTVCATCQLSIEEMYCFVQQIRSIDKKLHASINLKGSANVQVCNTRKKHKYNKTSKLNVEDKGNDFKCFVCLKTYTRYRNLEIHMNTHAKSSINATEELSKDSTNIENNSSNATVNDQDQKSIVEESCSLLIKDEEDRGSKSQTDDLEDKEDNILQNGNQEVTLLKKNKNTFPCTFSNCTKVCSSTYTLRTHLMKHEGKTPFLCVTCGKGFRTKNSLNCHEKIHAKVKAYVCDECNIRFSVSSNLRAHQRKHHEGIRYYCSQCPLVYISKYSLERHELVHTGIKEYKCETCKAAFYTNKELMKHQRYHQGLRLYKCEQCFKTFFEKHHLTIHMRGHTGERPYVCKIIGCGKSFTESQKLTRHLKARHPLH